MTRSAGQEGASCKARERRTGRAQTITGQVDATPQMGLSWPAHRQRTPRCLTALALLDVRRYACATPPCTATRCCALSASLLLPRATKSLLDLGARRKAKPVSCTLCVRLNAESWLFRGLTSCSLRPRGVAKKFDASERELDGVRTNSRRRHEPFAQTDAILHGVTEALV
ncbi:MAG: hypothetical protein ACI8W7_000394 [Gammaproteobacteria bacterium]|jgi:hypothetical protein